MFKLTWQSHHNVKMELENLARVYSVEEETTLTYLDLIRRAIQEKYALSADE